MFSEGVGPFMKILVLSLSYYQIGSIRIDPVNAAVQCLRDAADLLIRIIIRKTVTEADLETILVGRLVKRDPGDGVVKLFHLCQLGNILQLLFNFGLKDRFELKGSGDY